MNSSKIKEIGRGVFLIIYDCTLSRRADDPVHVSGQCSVVQTGRLASLLAAKFRELITLGFQNVACPPVEVGVEEG